MSMHVSIRREAGGRPFFQAMCTTCGPVGARDYGADAPPGLDPVSLALLKHRCP